MEFKKFNKIARLTRDCVVTEKIDGTNTQVFITNFYSDECIDEVYLDEYNKLQGFRFTEEIDIFIKEYCVSQKDNLYMFAGSRKRWITPDNDNYGFAKWVKENSDELFKLGKGQHFGEWWGQGIQRKYDMEEKVFSLFNTGRWVNYDTPMEVGDKRENCPKCCRVVPVLYTGLFDTKNINIQLELLKNCGSKAAPDFMKPEGIVIYHTAGRVMFKKTIEKDESPKSKVNNG